jgi:hypothetical protein
MAENSVLDSIVVASEDPWAFINCDIVGCESKGLVLGIRSRPEIRHG